VFARNDPALAALAGHQRHIPDLLGCSKIIPTASPPIPAHSFPIGDIHASEEYRGRAGSTLVGRVLGDALAQLTTEASDG